MARHKGTKTKAVRRGERGGEAEESGEEKVQTRMCALAEICKYQKSSGSLIRRLPFATYFFKYI